MNDRENPYVGPRSFGTKDKTAFYGREREIRQLTSLLIAERMVLIHSPSGAGKSSLIQAGLIPALEEEDFHVLPVIRVNAEPSGLFAEKKQNRYVYSVLISLEEKLEKEFRLPDAELAGLTLDQYLEKRQRPAGAPIYDVLIFDQFEETITMAPNDRESKIEFFKQITTAMANPNRWALFAIREDFLGALEPYLRMLPNHLACHFRLDLLDCQAALQAIRMPAIKSGVTFDEATAIQLFNDLASIQMQLPDGTLDKQTGLYVEPVQLQVVCYNLWQSLDTADTEINQTDLTAVGEVDKSLEDFYELSVLKAVASSEDNERAVRDWFETKLIRQGDIRGQVPLNPDKSDGLSNTAIQALIDSHVVRSEKRGPITWFELSHDRLIKPVKKNNANWYRTNLKAFQRQAKQWQLAGRPDEMLLKGTELAKAEDDAREVVEMVLDEEKTFLQVSKTAWQKANLTLFQRQTELWIAQGRPDSLLLRGKELLEAEEECKTRNVSEEEKKFLSASRRVRTTAEREKRRNLLVRRLAVAAMLALAVAVFLGISAINNANQAIAQSTLAAQAVMTSQANAAAASTAQAISEAEKLKAQAAEAAANQSEEEAIRQSELAKTAAQTAKAGQLAARSQLFPLNVEDGALLSGLLAVESGKRSPSFETNKALQRFINFQAVAFRSGPPEFQHQGAVNTVAISPDARLVASASDDSSIHVWEITSGYEVIAPFEHPAPVTLAAFSPNGQLLVSASLDNFCYVWDLVNGTMLLGVPHNAPIKTFAFSPDGQRVLSVDTKGRALLWDVWSGETLAEIQHSQAITAVAFSSDGHWAATASLDATVQVIDLTNNSVFTVLQENSPVTSLAFSPDATWLTTGAQDGTARVWMAEFSDSTPIQAGSSAVSTVAYFPGGHVMAIVRMDGTIRIWDPGANYDEPFTKLDGPADHFLISPDGTFVLTVNQDNHISVWDSANGFEFSSDTLDSTINTISISPDRQWLVTGDANGLAQVRTINLEGETGSGHSAYVSSAVFSPDERWVASGSYDGSVIIWDAENRAIVKELELAGYISVLAFSPNARWLAVGTGVPNVVIYDTNDWSIANTVSYQNPVSTLSFSPDGKLLATGSYENNAQVYETASWEQTAVLETSSFVSSLAFSADSTRVVTGTGDGTLNVWDVANKSKLAEQKVLSYIYRVAFSPDGEKIATASDVGKVELWDSFTLLQMKVIPFEGPVTSLAFDATGKLLVAASLDGTSKVVDTTSAEIITTVQQGSPVYNAAFSQDSRVVISGSENGIAQVWESSTGNAIAQVSLASAITAAALSPSGEMAVIGNELGELLIWHVSTNKLMELACQRLSRNLTLAEWTQYIGSEPYQATCPNLPPGQ